MKITIGRNTDAPCYYATHDGTQRRYGKTRAEALGHLITAFPSLLAPGVVLAFEDDPAPPGDSIVRELAEASTIGEPEPHPELDQACKDALRDREIATALSGRPLVPGAAAQLLKLWRDRFVVVEGESEYKVTTEYGHTPGTILPEWLKLPEYSHFLTPIPARNHATTLEAPRNLGEAIVARWKAETEATAEPRDKPFCSCNPDVPTPDGSVRRLAESFGLHPSAVPVVPCPSDYHGIGDC